MSKHTKLIGLVAGISAAASLGIASAQGTPPVADVANVAMGAGNLSIFDTPMGETGVLPVYETQVVPLAIAVPVEVQAAAPAPEVIVVEVPAEERTEQIAQAPLQPEPAPMVAQAPVYIEPERIERFEEPRMRADRN